MFGQLLNSCMTLCRLVPQATDICDSDRSKGFLRPTWSLSALGAASSWDLRACRFQRCFGNFTEYHGFRRFLDMILRHTALSCLNISPFDVEWRRFIPNSIRSRIYHPWSPWPSIQSFAIRRTLTIHCVLHLYTSKVLYYNLRQSCLDEQMIDIFWLFRWFGLL